MFPHAQLFYLTAHKKRRNEGRGSAYYTDETTSSKNKKLNSLDLVKATQAGGGDEDKHSPER